MGGRYAEGSTIKIYVTVLYAVHTRESPKNTVFKMYLVKRSMTVTTS